MNREANEIENPKERMRELTNLLNRASRAYYQEDREIMSNYEYDSLYDELVSLEKETGIVLSGSPTVSVGYEVVSNLEKEAHASPMLSLDKTKNVDELAAWLGNREGLLSWKMDGLTVVLTYRDGVLFKAVTRGNGEIGEIITNNAKTFVNIPAQIPYREELVIRGEAVIRYSDFNRINSQIADVDAKYKNPRNLCSGTVRQLDNRITAERNVNFFAFTLVDAPGVDFHNSAQEKFHFLETMGFEVVEYQRVTKETIHDAVQGFSERIKENDFPSDGLVLLYDDLEYGRSLGRTAKFPRNAIAFKWADETALTKLRYIEWSPSRTGLINPVAVFDPVELEGTTVSRASVHNISILEELQLGVGDELQVYKANMIIPQIAENLTKSGNVAIPKFCPACGGETKIRMDNDAKTLYCTNEYCNAKKLKSFAHYVSRNAMNIDGLSEATIERFLDEGILHELPDLYNLEPYRLQIVMLDGFGERSYENLIRSIEESKSTTLEQFLYALGIPNIGVSGAKLLVKHFQGDFERIRNATAEEMVCIEGIGDVIAESVEAFFRNPTNQARMDALVSYLHFAEYKASEESQIFAGMSFCVTGAVHIYENRDAVKAVIEARGGKVTGSVTSKTKYLINNDITSTSSKNTKAKELGIPIITEEEFQAMLEQA